MLSMNWMIVALILAVIQLTDSSLVLLTTENRPSTGSRAQFCALYRSAGDNVLETSYPLYVTDEINECTNVANESWMENGSVFVRLVDPLCPFSSVYNKVESVNSSMAILGTNLEMDLFHVFLNIPVAFMTLSDADSLKYFISGFKSPEVSVKRVGLFDISILVVVILAFVAIVLASVWNMLIYSKLLLTLKPKQVDLRAKYQNRPGVSTVQLGESSVPIQIDIQVREIKVFQQVDDQQVTDNVEKKIEDAESGSDGEIYLDKTTKDKIKELEKEVSAEREKSFVSVDVSETPAIHQERGIDVESNKDKVSSKTPSVHFESDKANAKPQDRRGSLFNFYRVRTDPNNLQAPASGRATSISHTALDVDEKQIPLWEKIMNLRVVLNYGFWISLLLIVFVAMVVFNYFAFDVAVWIFSVLFAILTGISLFSHGCLLIDKIKFLDYRIPENKFIKSKPKVAKLIYFVLCFVFCVVWLGCRNLSWSWGLQDVLVLSMLIFVLKFSFFRSYKYVIVVSVLFTAFDIFMIYILPTIESRANFMSSVAFGLEASYESDLDSDQYKINLSSKTFHDYLPFYLVIPNFVNDKSLCGYFYKLPYTFLGIGEIILPALSINYAFRFDISNGKRKSPIYYTLNLFGLVFGFFVAVMAVSFAPQAQAPALIICPTLIGINVCCALIKKELRTFLNGSKKWAEQSFMEQLKAQFYSNNE